MSTGRIIARIGIILFFAILGASAGICIQALRITGKPQEFRSLAKLVTSRQTGDPEMKSDGGPTDFYGTIIATLESAEMKRRALERVRALNPNLKDADVEIRVTQLKGSTIFNILATGTEPKYIKIFLDALLDEFMAFRQSIRESAQSKMLQQLLQEVAAKQKIMEAALARMEQAHSNVESLEAKAEQERRVARLIRLRDQRDDLRLQIKTLATDAAGSAPLAAKLGPIEQEIQTVETELRRYETAAAELEGADKRYQGAKMAYEKLFEKAEAINQVYDSSAEYVAIQERATAASENVEDWKPPIVIGAFGGGLLGAALGLLFSLIFVRPNPPLLPPAP